MVEEREIVYRRLEAVMLLALLAIAFVISILVLIYNNNDVTWVATIIWGLIFLIALIAWPIGYYGCKASIAEFESAKETIYSLRSNENVSEYELAAANISVVKWNTWLAGQQYWKGTFMIGYAYPGAVMRLKPIR